MAWSDARGPWTRRSVLRGIAALAGSASAALVAACGGGAPATTAPPAAPTTPAGATAAPAKQAPGAGARELALVFSGWILDQNPVVRDLAKEYGDANGLTVTLSSAPLDLQQKLLLEAQQGKSTWGGWEGHTAFLDTAKLAEANVITPWDKHVTGADRDDFLPTSWREQMYKGQVYTIPFRVSPLVMIYRPTLFDKLGQKEFPANWDDLIRLCEGAVKDLSTPGSRMNGIVFSTIAWYCLWTVMATLVKQPYNEDTGLANMDLPEAAQAFTIIKRLYASSAPDILSSPIENITQAGLSTVHFQHLLMKRRMSEALQNDLKLARLPRSATAQGTTYWSSGPNILKNYGAEEETAKFWLWLSQQKRLYDTLWLKNGSPPNRRSLWKQYEPLKGKELEAELWDVDAMQEQSQGIPNSLWISLQATHTKRVTDDFLLEKITSPEQAVAEIKKATEADIAKQQK